MHGRKPDVAHLWVWGCTAYVHVQKDKHAALDPHMEKCIFIGYPDGYKGWKFYNPTTKRTVISERADFDERHFMASKRSANVPGAPPHTTDHSGGVIDDSDDSDGEDLPPLHVQGQGGVGNPPVVPELPAVDQVAPAQPVDVSSVLDNAPAPAQPPADKFHTPPASPPAPAVLLPCPSPVGICAWLPARQRRPPREWWKLSNEQLEDNVEDEDEDTDLAFLSAVSEPRTYAEAMHCSDASQWHQAALDELAAHRSNGTWCLVNRPLGHQIEL